MTTCDKKSKPESQRYCLSVSRPYTCGNLFSLLFPGKMAIRNKPTIDISKVDFYDIFLTPWKKIIEGVVVAQWQRCRPTSQAIDPALGA